MVNDEQLSVAQTLTNLADMGELVLLTMTPPALGFFQDLVIADNAAKWAQLARAVVRITIGESEANELAPGTPDRDSPDHPQPKDISPDLAEYWNSVAWRIDRLREWAMDTG